MLVPAVRMADFQTSWRVIDHQPSLPDSSCLVHRHPVMPVFHPSHGVSVVGSAVQRGSRKSNYIRKIVQNYVDHHACRKSRFLSVNALFNST
jgi:hypothetical protein